jgi:hypothetical protein
MPDNQQIVFVQYHEPGLEAGDYEVHAELLVKNLPSTAFSELAGAASDATQRYFIDRYLRVSGDRFALSPGSVDSVYPPPATSGEYSRAVPHVVLRRPTLPWERTISDKAREHTPWLALLLITEAELRGEKLDLIHPTKTTSKQDNGVEVTCETLTISGALWSQLAPTAEELPFLAHVRRVVPDRKNDTAEEVLEFALVIANRMPPKGESCYAFLVSLEGMATKLPPAVVAGQISLTVLHAWRFFAVLSARSFGRVVKDLDHATGLSLPHEDAGVASAPLSMGFKPVSHALRVGGTTWSWYRGPFTPYGTGRRLRKAGEKPVPWADGVLFYDPELGMMDVSCASAWTLGRLMALNDTSFAATLYKWKREKVRGTLERARFQLNFGRLAGTGCFEDEIRDEVEEELAAELVIALIELGGTARERVPEPLTASMMKRSSASARKSPSASERIGSIERALDDKERIVELHHLDEKLSLLRRAGFMALEPATSDAIIATWLGDCALMKGIPAHYLVPDERMLPAESIRFFQIDDSWIEAFRDGALSLGRDSATDLVHDEAFMPVVAASTEVATGVARPQTRRLLANGNGPAVRQPKSGFVMRSDALAQWPDMEVEASACGVAAITLRQQMVGPILICLFDRLVDNVELHQPSEAVHFGFSAEDHPDKIAKKRRDATGRETDVDPLGAIPFRAGDLCVLDILALVQWMAGGASYRSDQFALQMVTGVDRVVFKIKQPTSQ